MKGLPGERIRKARENAGLSQYELEAASGVKRATINAWENGLASLRLQRTEQRERVRRIAAALGVPESYIWEGKPDIERFSSTTENVRENTQATEGHQLVYLPYYGTVPAGNFDIPTSDVERRPVEDPRLAKEGRFLITATGDSMTPRIIHGDELLVERTTEPRDGVICLLKAEDGNTVKLLKRTRDGAWRLVPVNPEHPEIELVDGLQMIGVVLSYKRMTSTHSYIREFDEAGLRVPKSLLEH
jgi:SOS-response transcriptional repressor LexA